MKNVFFLFLTLFISLFLRVNAQEKFNVDTSVKIPLRNGLKLSAVLVTHKGNVAAQPVIFVTNCYPNPGLRREKTLLPMIAQAGFTAITVFPRGKAFSEGTFHPFENDAQDNYDVIDWISKQPWCNGNVGMFGGSYLGFAQWATVKNIHPALKTIVPMAPVGPGIDFPYNNGVMKPYVLQWIKGVRNGKFDDKAVFRDGKKWDALAVTYLKDGYAFNRLDSLEGHGTDTIFQRWLRHPTYDNYWKQMIPTREEYAKINIPILTITGYFDDDQRGAMYYYDMHSRYGNPEVVKNHYLFIGPFDHGGSQGFPVSRLDPYDIDSAALESQFKMIMEWYNYTLKGAAKPVLLKDRISVFAMGENKWRYFPSVEKMNRPKRFYLLNNKAGVENRYMLRQGSKPGNLRPIDFTYDTRFHSADTLKIFKNDNSVAALDVFMKKDLLLFQTEVFDSSFILNGIIKANLFISSSVPDADLLITWWEEDSSGVRWPISNVHQRLSYDRHSVERRLLQQGKTYSFVLDNSYWMCKQIQAGSRLLMTLSPLTNLRDQKNYGDKKAVSQQTRADRKQVSIKIYNNNQYEGYIDVPVIAEN
jgi:putative CocE/NonD family hydrolase